MTDDEYLDQALTLYQDYRDHLDSTRAAKVVLMHHLSERGSIHLSTIADRLLLSISRISQLANGIG
jgi:DNA-binding MarR family transcriptional regulator